MSSKYENNLNKTTKILVSGEQKKINLQSFVFFDFNGTVRFIEVFEWEREGEKTRGVGGLKLLKSIYKGNNKVEEFLPLGQN